MLKQKNGNQEVEGKKLCTLCHYVASTVEEPLFCSTYLYAYVLPTTDISTETQLKLCERTKPGQCPKLSFLSFRKQQGAVCCSPTLTSENEAPFLLLLIIQSSLFYKQHLLTHYYSTLCYSLLYSCHIHTKSNPNPGTGRTWKLHRV